MPKVTLPRLSSIGPPRTPIDAETSERPAAAPWVWPAIVAVACGPFVLTAIGLAVTALRPQARPATDVATSVVEPAVAAEPSVAPLEQIAAAPRMVEDEEAAPAVPSPAVAVEPPAKPAPVKPVRCDRFGTAIDFVRSPTLAFDRAARDQKLVMVLHLAGYFDDPGFT